MAVLAPWEGRIAWEQRHGLGEPSEPLGVQDLMEKASGFLLLTSFFMGPWQFQMPGCPDAWMPRCLDV